MRRRSSIVVALTLVASLAPRPAAMAQGSGGGRDLLGAFLRGGANRQEVLASEALIRELENGPLAAVGKSVMNLALPDATLRAAQVFEDEVWVRPMGPVAARRVEVLDGAVEQRASGPAGREVGLRGPETVLWPSLLAEVAYFDYARFYVVRGVFLGDRGDAFETDLGFTGRARLRDGRVAGYAATLRVEWRRHGAGEQARWRIHAWATDRVQRLAAAHLLFAEVLDAALPARAARARVRHSEHRRYVRRAVLERERYPATWHAGEATDDSEHYPEGFVLRGSSRHPGVAVVDLDRDGFDDVFVVRRYGPSLFLRNRGNGTFEEIGAELGLDVADHNSAAVFADFDNDGDSDLFLARTLRRGRYYVNEDGRFVDRSAERIGVPVPSHVDSVAAVDYNGDGLLDLYLSTYDSRTVYRIFLRLDGRELMQRLMLPPAQEDELYRRARFADVLTDRPGPPNVLLENAGNGRFVLSPFTTQVEGGWRNTHQSTWGDYDNDGDPDLYVANDIAPNNFYRNDGPDGFADVTRESGTSDIGFGMGASWADYDADGRLDLYVTNMFSKAGRRIAQGSGFAETERADMARGNSLFRNQGDGAFERVSGLASPALLVEKAGWGWGGQFVDADNDGFWDIYTLSGQHTGVAEAENPGDT